MKYHYDLSYVNDRDSYIFDICREKKVLHIGACDAPYTKQKKESNLLLHEGLDRVASELLGIDIDENAISIMQDYGFDNVIKYDMNQLSDLDFIPDVIVFGETLEHLLNFESVFQNFKSIMKNGTTLLISTPNSLYFKNFFNALGNRENNHPDHTVSFTPRTLEYMIESNGFFVTKMTTTFLKRKKERLPKKIKKFIISLYPMLAETLVYECKIS